MSIEQAILTNINDLTRRARRLTEGDEAAALDLVQSTALRAMERADQYDPSRGEPRQWLFTLLRNLFFTGKRHDRVVDRHRDTVAARHEALSVDHEAVMMENADPYHARVWEAMARLPEAHREAIVMHSVEGLTYREIGDVLGVPMPTVRTWIYRGRGRVRDALQSA